MQIDWCSHDGARALAQTIAEYWVKRHGVHPDVRVVDGPFLPQLRHSRHDVRSNMVNGLPLPLFLNDARGE